ncbi:MAG: glucose-1-phosphate cytidylyltransferase [Lachnospiraceae bacterium]|nr:glucose-1-phosphate cytidylyltransferase [Lachnospiraceae bacterium]MDE7333526.1 glucose-1-phosphate cytidylyltransferase [Lachnospiraceae bacterium]
MAGQMKVLILAGGSKSTISEDREGIPKPMVEIGEKPLLWHIMKQYGHFGFDDFLICGGYKVNVIKNYFRDYYIYQSDITVDLATNQVEIHKKVTENWKVTVADTGLFATTGQRVSQAEKYIRDDRFLVTYGDCLSDINIKELVEFSMENDKLVTMAVAKPTGRNVVLPIDENDILGNLCAAEPEGQSWTNACTFVFKKGVFPYLNGNYELDKQLLPTLSEKGQIAVYKHRGFWCPVETRRDKVDLETRWNAAMAPWKVW